MRVQIHRVGGKIRLRCLNCGYETLVEPHQLFAAVIEQFKKHKCKGGVS